MNKSVKKIVLGVFTVGIILAGSYGLSPKVRNIVDDVVENIQNNIINQDELQQLDSVTNISFNEKERLLTFDEILNAKGYKILLHNKTKDLRYNYESPVASVQVDFVNATESGDVIEFTVTALGDYVTTSNSEESSFTHTVQFEDLKRYDAIKDILFDSVILDLEISGLYQILSLDTFDYDNGNLTMKGVALNHLNKSLNFEISYDVSEASELFDNIESANDFYAAASYINNIDDEKIQRSYLFSEDMVDLTDVLLTGSGLINEYQAQGYTIEALQQSYSEVMVNGDMVSFEVTGVYMGTNASGEIVTFEATNTIEMDKVEAYVSVEQYVAALNSGAEKVVSEESSKTFDATVISHLNEVQALHEEELEQSQDFNQ